jgi:hypothetical protein
MKVKVVFTKLWLAVMIVTLVASITSAATTVYASSHKKNSDSSTSSVSKGSDTSGSSTSGPTAGPGSSGSQSSSSISNPPSSWASGGQSSGISNGANPPGPPPSPPPGQPSNPSSSGGCDHPLRPPCLPVSKPQTTKECPNGEVVDINAKCPTPVTAPPGHTKDFGQGFSAGSEDGKSGVYDPAAACAGASNTAHCIQGYNDSYVASCTHGRFGCGDGPTTCAPSEKCIIPIAGGGNGGKCNRGNGTSFCPPPRDCVKINNMTIICKPRIVEHNTQTTITQLVPGLAANTNHVNLFLVTTCTADQNNGVLNGNLAALCDASITMMHDDGLDAQLPQVDLYLKARGLLQ